MVTVRGEPVRGTARASLRSDAVFVAGMLVVDAFRNGFGERPRLRFYATTFVNALPRVPHVPPLTQWRVWSPIGSIAARLVGIHTIDAFALLHLAVTAIGLAVLVVAVRQRYGSLAMRLALVAFVALPVSVVIQGWLGNYDAWMFVCSTAVVVTRSWKLAAVAGVGLALANFEQGAFILVLLLLITGLRLDGAWPSRLAAGGGLVAGRIALGIWLHRNGVRYGRIDYERHLGAHYLLTVAEHRWVLLLISLVGASLPLLWCVARGGWRQQFAVLAVLALSLVPMVLATDETRVYALTTWAPLLALVLGETGRAPDRVARALRPTIVLCVLVPGFFIWLGRPFLARYQWIELLRR